MTTACIVCRGPAYVGLSSVECINPKCAPFDPITTCTYAKIPAPSWMRAQGYAPHGLYVSSGIVCAEAWPYFATMNAPEGVETAWAVEARCSAAYEFPRATKEECFAAWAEHFRHIIDSEPARRTARALMEALSVEGRQRVARALGHEHGLAFPVDDWERFAWAAYEESRR